MSAIKILPEIVSNKIAAGEVVERPASVVKELVENAMDAESSKILIEVEKGGKSLIRVSDNGAGMSKDDALLSIERYATSKIYNDKDLYAIRTLGFRGEALPSICSVSRFSLVTKENHSEVGTEIVVQGGKITSVSDAGAPPGTMITVKQLFYNTPARRKFLKTIGTEMGHISDTISGIALGRPDIRFKLVSEGKVVKDWLAASEATDRVADVLGTEVNGRLLSLASESKAVSIDGWIAKPQFTRSTTRGIYVYVNGRHVRDRMINHALFEGYGQRLMKGKFPLAVLFITVPYDQVDVNVHPAKHEVRFSKQKEIHTFIAKAVSQALGGRSAPMANWQDIPQTTFQNKPAHISEAVQPYIIEDKVEKTEPGIVKQSVFEQPKDQPVLQPEFRMADRFERPRVIGQFRNTYILCESESGLVLIDQHAAHERILFEQLKKRADEQESGSQRLLVPETIDAGYSEVHVLEKLVPDLVRAGIEIEHFGKGTFIVKAVPAILAGKEIKPVIFEIVEQVADIGFASGVQETIDTCLILMACHGAIRANQPLSDEEMNELVQQLSQCDVPSHCPHGRPTFVNWSKGFLEKSFGRTG